VLNERNEFLITTIPISPVSSLTTKAAAVLPHFIDAGNWYPHLVMVNPTNSTVSGRLEFFGIGSSSTNPVSVLIGGATGYTHNYSIPARSSRKISLTRSYDRLTVGTIRVTPTTGSSPHSFAILSYMTNGITLSSTVVPAVSTPTTSRIYTQTAGVWGNKGSLQSALTIANTGSTSANVQISVTDLNGASTGLSTSRYIAAGSHIVQYMNQLFPTMPNPFRGVVKVTAPVDVTVTGLRTMYNERGEFLISNVPGLNSPTTSSMEFPYVLTGQGYSTQLVLVNPLQTQSTGKLVSLSAAGDPVPPFFETP
jgi:hypothetical protein